MDEGFSDRNQFNKGEEGVGKHYIEIPKVFRSSETGKPFDHCMVCNKYLLDDGTPYMIEKAVRNYPDVGVQEVIFEYALCTDCAIKFNEAISTETKQRIAKYFSNPNNIVPRNEPIGKNAEDVQPWINQCIAKGTIISESAEYQLIGQCEGKHLLLSEMPFALSHEAMDEIASLMSVQSLGEIDDFIGTYFTGPPEVAELLKRRLIFV